MNHGTSSFKFKGTLKKILTAHFSPDGGKIVTASADSTAEIWDASTGKCIDSLIGHKAALVDAQFSPDNTKIVTASRDSTAKIWDAKSGQLLKDLVGHKDRLLL